MYLCLREKTRVCVGAGQVATGCLKSLECHPSETGAAEIGHEWTSSSLVSVIGATACSSRSTSRVAPV